MTLSFRAFFSTPEFVFLFFFENYRNTFIRYGCDSCITLININMKEMANVPPITTAVIIPFPDITNILLWINYFKLLQSKIA